MRPVIRNFKEKGVRFAVDDFGAGHTNFSEVLNLEIDILKIDKQFIAQSADAGRSAFFIEALQGLANKIGIVTIGEGVETLKQKESFLNQGVRAVQGYLYGRPSLEKAWCAA